ncbi:MAG: phosphatidate phosphatase App1 family protein [Pirellula sp.]
MSKSSTIRSSTGSHPSAETILRMSPELPNRHAHDPRVTLYPTIGFPLAGGQVWRVIIQGRISQDAPASFGKRLMLKGLIRALDLSREEASSELFGERIDGFLTSPIAGQRIQVELAGQHYVLRRKSKRSGLFSCKLDLPAKQLRGFKSFGQILKLDEDSSASRRSTADHQTQATESLTANPISAGCPVLLAEESGISVVSDIDDTIKLTEVTSRRRMLQRTFAIPFEPIEGMADVYQHWANQGALFHYVSSSPWQIYSPIDRFLRSENFPVGSMHLKWFRLRDEIFKRWQILRRKSKSGVIRGLMKRLPNRSFVLVGDSGEKDPEIYAKIASKFPKQVIRICIRQIEANPLDGPRLDAIYRRHGMIVPIQVFSNAVQLGDVISG